MPGALADFAQGFFADRAEAARRRELAREEMSAYERKLRLQQELQEKLEASKVADRVPDLQRGVMVLLNSQDQEIGTRPLTPTEMQSYLNKAEKEAADVRGALARAVVDEKQARDYDEDKRLSREYQRIQAQATRQYAENAAAANRRAEAEFLDNSGALGPPRRLAGGGGGSSSSNGQPRLSVADLRRISEDEAIAGRIGDILVKDRSSESPMLSPEQHEEFRQLAEAAVNEQDPIKKMQLLARIRTAYGHLLQQRDTFE